MTSGRVVEVTLFVEAAEEVLCVDSLANVVDGGENYSFAKE
jgi:hypothetical protein